MTNEETSPEPIDESAMTYEQLVEALEEVTRRMADGQIGIEEATDLYERARRLHDLAAQRLERVRERIERLSQQEDTG